jgi:hypothetical protein
MVEEEYYDITLKNMKDRELKKQNSSLDSIMKEMLKCGGPNI